MKSPRSSTTAASLIAAVGIAAISFAQSPVTTPDLPDSQLESSLVQPNSLALPSPGELLYVLSKEGSPKWRKLYQPVLLGQESDRSKIAMRLGHSIAEGHLASMARDAQKIRDITNDLQRYSKVLGISDGLIESSRSINDAAAAKSWANVSFQLEALVTEASEILKAQRDADLAKLISAGMWVRLLHVSSNIVTTEDFTDPTTAIGSHWMLLQIVAPLEESTVPTVIFTRDQLAKIARTWAPEKFSAERRPDDELISESHQRLDSIIQQFGK